ncbi:MAG: hypothetical protein HYV07_16395 [Deltaproteobacteria bacterium]|nr:hypothetical protein [Deltaproteobacteria bacterium]
MGRAASTVRERAKVSQRQVCLPQAAVCLDILGPVLARGQISGRPSARGLVVTGSEIVGLVPLDAILMAGRYYLPRETGTLEGRSQGRHPRDGGSGPSSGARALANEIAPPIQRSSSGSTTATPTARRLSRSRRAMLTWNGSIGKNASFSGAKRRQPESRANTARRSSLFSRSAPALS